MTRSKAQTKNPAAAGFFVSFIAIVLCKLNALQGQPEVLSEEVLSGKRLCYWTCPIKIYSAICRLLHASHLLMRHLFALSLLLFSAQALAQCKATPAEGFQDFIVRFSESKSLATSRTIYPTYTLRHVVGWENGKELTSAVKTTVSKAEDEATPTIKQILSKNQMAMNIKDVRKKQATVEVSKPDTDWLLTYHFVERQGCWYLHHIEDHSL